MKGGRSRRLPDFNYQIFGFVHPKLFVRRNYRGRAVFRDYGGAAHGAGWDQVSALEHWRRQVFIVKEDGRILDGCQARRRLSDRRVER